jgi:hypothetical protein
VTTSIPLLVIYVLAVLRLTRLINVDEITVWFRDWLAQKAHVGQVLNSGEASRADRFFRSLWKLVHCSWCVSMWIAIPVTVLARFEGAWWSWVCATLALSSASGLIADRS